MVSVLCFVNEDIVSYTRLIIKKALNTCIMVEDDRNKEEIKQRLNLIAYDHYWSTEN